MMVPWALAGGAGALGLLALGTFHPRVALFGPVVSSGPRRLPRIALTFDDGPHPDFTPRIAKLLCAHGARATFFCVGAQVAKHSALARELSAQGHALENHTFRHDTFGDLFSATRLTADLRRCQDAIADAVGRAPRYYRPAVGIRNPAVHAAARAVGLTVVTWSDAARDGVRTFTAEAAEALAGRTRAGAVLTLHDGTLSNRAALREHTVQGLPTLLRGLSSRGLELVTLGELLEAPGP